MGNHVLTALNLTWDDSSNRTNGQIMINPVQYHIEHIIHMRNVLLHRIFVKPAVRNSMNTQQYTPSAYFTLVSSSHDLTKPSEHGPGTLILHITLLNCRLINSPHSGHGGNHRHYPCVYGSALATRSAPKILLRWECVCASGVWKSPKGQGRHMQWADCGVAGA